MSKNDFFETGKNTKNRIKKYYDLIEKNPNIFKPNSNPNDDEDFYLIGLHVLISDQIYLFLKALCKEKFENYFKDPIIVNAKEFSDFNKFNTEISNAFSFIDNNSKKHHPNEKNIENFLKFFDPNFKDKFFEYKIPREQPYTSFDAFNKIYESRNCHVHGGASGNKLGFKELKKYEEGIYKFIDDVIAILNP
jgi:hypothetical protein